VIEMHKFNVWHYLAAGGGALLGGMATYTLIAVIGRKEASNA
jgi:hypothetical protein